MRLSHNMASLNIYMTHKKVSEKQSKALNNISTGYKVNNAKDDPNAIAQSERMRMQIRGLQMAGKNTQDGVSMLQTAEGGMNSITEMLQRIRELTVNAGNDSTTSNDKVIMQNEVDQMIKGINDIVNNTEFNGKKLLDFKALKEGTLSPTGNYAELEMAVGSNSGESVKIPIYDLSSSALKITSGALSGKSIDDIDITSSGNNINDALNIVDNAINMVVTARSKYGALENRFEGSLDDLNQISQTMEGADSNIRDADIATEILEYSKDGILLDAGNAIMAQTNKFPQEILSILESVKSR